VGGHCDGDGRCGGEEVCVVSWSFVLAGAASGEHAQCSCARARRNESLTIADSGIDRRKECQKFAQVLVSVYSMDSSVVCGRVERRVERRVSGGMGG